MIKTLFGKRDSSGSYAEVDALRKVTRPVGRMIAADAVHPNGQSVEIDGNVIEYRDVIQLVVK